MAVVSAQRRSTAPLIAVVALSLLAGLFLAIVFVLGPAAGETEAVITGAVLVTFGLGWLLIASLSVRFTDQPQRWAFTPAAFMGLPGLALVIFAPGIAVMDLLGWLWPPAVFVLAAWSLVQIRRHVQGRSRWLLYPVVAVLFIFAVAGGLETVLAAVDEATQPRTGQLVDVGGRRLHVECTGTGEPTVVFESGLAQGSRYWGRIAPAVAESTRVCVYDRAGRGGSDPASSPQDGAAVASDLHALLANLGEQGPYLLVGHSTGGPYIRVFAATYPDDVGGMVLLDAQPAEAFTALPDFPAAYDAIRTTTALFPSLARLGVFRLVYATVSTDLPPPYREAQRAEQSLPRLQQGQRDEFAVLPSTLRQAQALATLGDKPLIVVSAPVDAQRGWLAAQEQMVRLSSNSSQRVAADQDHASIIESERGAAISAQAILDVLAAIRSGAPVGG